jgi:hypothetical protein
MSHHKSQFPLEVIYLDVWGPTSVFARGYKYYVSFIDDYSKFIWIYLLKFKCLACIHINRMDRSRENIGTLLK